MKLHLKMNWSSRRAAIEDLRRPHDFAHERIGFFGCRAAEMHNGLIMIVESYMGIPDDNYIRDSNVGARINGDAIRAALQLSLTKGVGLFHIHMHEHFGKPTPSKIDIFESKKLVPDFFNVTPSMPHGILILSEDSAFGMCWLSKHAEPKIIDRIEFVGSPLSILDFVK